jgi:hypothetical protein
MSFAIAAVVTAGVGTAYSIYSGTQAAGAAKSAGAEQARIERQVTQAKIEQTMRQEMLMREATVAGTAASGVSVKSKSTLEVMADQAAQFRKEMATIRQVGESNAAVLQQNAGMVGSQYRSQGIAQGIQGAANVFSMINTIRTG